MTDGVIASGINVSIGGREIIHNADIEIAMGEITILIGPNGAGKSTLMKALLGLIECGGGSM
ncbi:MAG: zinc transporter, partial [Hyphomonadaceae bacterium]